MDWPALAINVITYNRRDILLETLHRLQTHLWYEGARHVVVADDGSDDGTVEMVRERYPEAVLVQSQRVGMGANANAGLRAALSRAEYVLQLQDDMWLQAHLDIHPHIGRLMDDPTSGYVRLWGVAGHRYEGRLEGMYWRIYWHSPDLYIPSDRPHLKARRFHELFGFYPEGLRTSDTEDAWCHQCKDRAGLHGRQLDVLVPLSVDTEKSWEHAGWHSRWRDKGL